MSTAECGLSVGFLEHPERPLFHVLLQPHDQNAKGSVLFLHAFAEEMHKSRRNVATQARELADAGYNVLLLDLTGCGDGAGEFVDANWQTWREDALFALNYLRTEFSLPVTLWGLRLGGLLASELAQSQTDIARLVLWQPVLNGEQQIDQFLRLRSAASVISNGAVFDRKTLWGELREGRTLEVAGYLLSPTMALEIAGARLQEIVPACPVVWLEIGGLKGALARPSQNVVANWEDRGVDIETVCLPGEPFWRNHDTPVNQDLMRLTREVFEP